MPFLLKCTVLMHPEKHHPIAMPEFILIVNLHINQALQMCIRRSACPSVSASLSFCGIPPPSDERYSVGSFPITRLSRAALNIYDRAANYGSIIVPSCNPYNAGCILTSLTISTIRIRYRPNGHNHVFQAPTKSNVPSE